MELKNENQYIGFGVGIVNRFSRNRYLHVKDTVMGILSSIKHMRVSPTLTYRKNAHAIAERAYAEGIRVFDTARIYGYSEYELGKMIQNHKREDVFICTKVSDMDLTREGGAKTVRGNLENSLKDLKTDYIDLYLLHWPSGDWISMYSEMVELFREGAIRHLGVCNFKVKDFLELEGKNGFIMPRFCQIECHPFCQNREVIDYCQSNGIRILAHTPTGRMSLRIRENAVLKVIAEKHHKTVAQVIMRWHIQDGRIPVTHTKKDTHIKENTDIFDFELTQEDMDQINLLDTEESLFHFVGIDNLNYKYNK